MPYKTETINITQEFGATKSSKGADYFIRYVPMAWLPTKVQKMAMELAAEERRKAKESGKSLEESLADRQAKIESGEMDEEEVREGMQNIERLIPILAEVIDDWNLEYTVRVTPEDLDEPETEESKPLPLPRRLAKSPSHKHLIFEVPTTILWAVMDKAQQEDGSIPLVNDKPSSTISSPVEATPQNSLAGQRFTVVPQQPGEDPEATWDRIQESGLVPTGTPIADLAKDPENISLTGLG